jgi:hypothetical protein
LSQSNENFKLVQVDSPKCDDDEEAELLQWFQKHVKLIKPKNAKKYVTSLVGMGIDSVHRLLRAANDPKDEYVKAAISSKMDLDDFNAAVASMTKESPTNSHVPTLDTNVS